ncbi:phosphate-selective porin OprO and OprP [Sphingomonas laterariae]|uniref:Phosphate-selective porin OprO and OprP n=1 Tax=Edaphosphingomonas laterariae TaxID=861865 RepID=A0A239EG10_9SPHN|nr:porin [Sphingomonas laterariae]SNS42842.1 phosphate-selective porin OprO and OprP [Sphingomonas laterariae]
MSAFLKFPVAVPFGIGLALALPAPLAAQTISAAEAEALRQEIRELKAKLADVENRLGPETPAAAPAAPAAAAKAPPPATTIQWKGSPQFVSEDRAFKVKGRIQADAGYVTPPDGTSDQGFGSTSEFRRIRLGGEGKLGGGIGYKLEVELSDNAVDLVDTFVTYETKSWLISIGNQNQFQSLDELTGDTTGSTMERAAFTDAFNFERRLGIAAQYRAKDWLFQAGLFTDDIGALSNDSDGPDGGDENNSYGVDGRIVFAPKVDGTQLHFGASGHWRTLNRLTDSSTRYRQRPYLHGTNSRVLATPSMNVENEVHYGAEAAMISGPWHAVGEVHWLRSDQRDAPTAGFFGGYAEVGYFFTKGDTRSYKNGIFGGVNPASPLNDGGMGALQLNLRYDYLDLIDRSAGIVGGKQNAIIAALVWTPIDYLRLNLNYGYLMYDDAAINSTSGNDYNLHVVGTRIELDF